MSQWPPNAVTTITDTVSLGWPSRTEVGPLAVVGPTAENQQPTALATRTETLREGLNLLAAMFNEVREFFLDRDGADPAIELEGGETSDQGPVWMRGDLPMGGFRIRNLAEATDTLDLVRFEQLEAVQFAAEDDVDQVLANFVYRVDGSVQGAAALDAGNKRVINVGDAVDDADVIRKGIFDVDISDLRASLVLRSAGTMTSDLDLDGPLVTDPGFFVVELADPTANGDLVNKRFLDEQIALVGAEDVPTGVVLPYAGTSVPANFLICDGREVSRFTYQNLFNTIGIAFGTPSSSSLFRLPDVRGRVIVGRDNMANQPANRITDGWADALGGVGGSETHPLTVGELPAHDHSYDDHLFAEGIGGAEDGGDDGTDANNVYAETVRTTGTSGSGLPHLNLQPSMTQLYIIRI